MPLPNALKNPATVCRRFGHAFPPRTMLTRQTPEKANANLPPVLHFLPINARGTLLHFQPFDEAYLSRLRAGDFRTQEHFSSYFGALIKIKLGSRLKSPEAIDDVRQETFTRFLIALRDGKIHQPERLGSFVNSICNNVLLEHYRSGGRSTSIEDEDEQTFTEHGFDLVAALATKETEKKVREILEKIPERDRRLLREIFIDERDKDEVCRDFGVDREYLRVLLHRAKRAFKSSYLKHTGGNPQSFAPV